MGTIGVGYLLNGTSGYENVNDYNYVTDVTGLYSYTPVPAYAEYSPATNNYRYSDSLSTLGTYTSGINYTQATAANLNPIITPSSGVQTVSGSLLWEDIPKTDYNYESIYVGTGEKGNYSISPESRSIPLSTLVGTLGEYTTATIHIPSPTQFTYPSQNLSFNFQPIGLYVKGSEIDASAGNPGISQAISAAIANKGSVGYLRYGSSPYHTTGTNSFTYVVSNSPSWNGTYTMSTPVGIVSDITINPNGTASYTYTYGGVPELITRDISDLTLCVFKQFEPYSSWHADIPEGITWSKTYVENVTYLDPNYGVSLSGDTAYWNNGNDLGSVTWAFEKPATSSSIRIAAMSPANATMTNFIISYDSTWRLAYHATSADTTITVDLGSGWQAMYVRMYYTGEIQVGPIERFFNFTNYELGLAQTYSTYYTGNVPFSYCKIIGSTSMKFAAIGTTVQSGTVPGAMFDATFNAGTYFPQYADVRISFDSAAYVGTSVQVDTWTMSVDSSSFYGQFTDLDDRTYFVDLTQPWAITWNPGSNEVSITFTPRNEAGTITATILNADVAKAVTLNGQWVIDTDLYSVGSHVEEVFNWDFGNWGLDKTQFIVCAMGLTALLSIAFRLAHVPFKGLDYVVIFFGNLILWVVL